MIILFVLCFIGVMYGIYSDKIWFSGFSVAFIMFNMVLFPVSDFKYDYSNIVSIPSDYEINCYKVVGGFFHDYAKVDCNSSSAELTKNESMNSYYFNKLTNKSCNNYKECAIKTKKTWSQKWL